MPHLSAFADEISPVLSEQIAVLHNEGIRFLDLRSVAKTNVLDLNDEQVAEIKQTLDHEGISVAALGSPLGKVAIDAPLEEQLRRLNRAVEIAQYLDTRYIRIFSFYPPQGANLEMDENTYRDEVIRRLREMTLVARTAGITLLHENEKDIYGDVIAHCVEIHECNDSNALRAVLDPANFLQCQQVPYPDGYTQLRPWLEYVHVKDVNAEGTLVVAGEGEARWPQILQQLRTDGYDGFLSLEPHLSASGKYDGFSGPELFRQASQALQRLLREMDWQYD